MVENAIRMPSSCRNFSPPRLYRATMTLGPSLKNFSVCLRCRLVTQNAPGANCALLPKVAHGLQPVQIMMPGQALQSFARHCKDVPANAVRYRSVLTENNAGHTVGPTAGVAMAMRGNPALLLLVHLGTSFLR